MDPVVLILLIVGAVAAAGAVALVVSRRRSLPAPKSKASLPSAAPETAAPPRLADRLGKSRRALGERLRAAFGRGTVDDDLWDALEEALIAADVGVETATEVVAAVKADKPEDGASAREALREELLATLAGVDRTLHLEHRPAVVMVVGVNGVGKTTTIAKLAARLAEQGKTALLGAADTFRAAADTQLRTWADRVGVEIVSAESGADPASVAFDAYQAAKARSRDVVIVDTAGRLHSKANLMAELTKIAKVLSNAAGSIDETLLVLDATTGQNGLAQTEQFMEAVGVTGVVLTKMDGTAKGGIALAVERRLGVPVKYIGVGEGVDDLIPFDPEEFVDAILADA